MGDDKEFHNMVVEFLAEIRKIPVNRARKKPLIGLVGEIYLRVNPYTNGDIVRQLESLGAEVHLAPLSEFIFNGTEDIKVFGDSLFGKFLGKLKYKYLKRLDASVVKHFEDGLMRPNFGQGRDADTVAKYGKQYTGNYCGGEGPLTLGAIEDYARHGADGVIMIGPMGCMPNIIYKGLFEKVKDYLPENRTGMPLIEITISESLNFKNMRTRIEPFINQAKDYLKTK
jgi:predicted nucleotide-binding protein (sugar kinase/HSP70/actin superfamily)